MQNILMSWNDLKKKLIKQFLKTPAFHLTELTGQDRAFGKTNSTTTSNIVNRGEWL